MAKKEKKKAVFLEVLRSFQEKFKSDPDFFSANQQKQLKSGFISLFAPDLTPEQRSELEEEDNFGQFLARLIKMIEESETLAELVAEETLERDGVVPDKVTLEELVEEMEKAKKEAAQARNDIDSLIDRLIKKLGFSRPEAEKTVKVLAEKARFSDKGEERNTGQALTAVEVAVSGEKGADVVLRAELMLKIIENSFVKLNLENLGVDPALAAAAVVNLPPAPRASMDSSLPEKAGGEVGQIEKELSSLSPEQIRSISQAENYQEKLSAAREVSPELAPQLIALLEAKMALGRLRAMPARVVGGLNFANIRRMVSKSLGPIISQDTDPEIVQNMEEAASETLASPPGWADFACQTMVDEKTVESLPKTVKTVLGEKRNGTTTVADVERAVFEVVSHPQTAGAWLSFPESESLGEIYRLKAFFRSPSENNLLMRKIDSAVLAGRKSPWITPLQHQRELIQTVKRSFPYRLRWGAGRLLSPVGRIGRLLGRPTRTIGINRLPGIRWLFSRAGGLFSSWKQKGVSWLARKAAGWGSKVLAKKGISSLLKGGLMAAVGGVEAASGPPGWLVAALTFGGGALKKLGGHLVGWLSSFNPANLVFGGRRAAEAEGKKTWWMLAVAAVGLPVLVVVLVFFGVATVVSSLWVSNQELGGVGVDQAYLRAVAANRINCSVASSSPIAQKACQLENLIRDCTAINKGEAPRVDRGSINSLGTCLRGKGIDPDTIKQLRLSVEGAYALDYNLQCVGFLKAAYPQLRGYPVSGAKEFYDIFGGSYDLTGARPGDVMVASSGQYGHAAIVTGVDLPNEAGGEMFVRLTQADGYSGGVFTSKISLAELKARGFVILNIE